MTRTVSGLRYITRNVRRHRYGETEITEGETIQYLHPITEERVTARVVKIRELDRGVVTEVLVD